MKKFLFILIIGISVLVGCSEKKNPSPANLISEDKMIVLLTDIRLLEGAYSIKYRQVDTSAVKIESYYEKIFLDNGITKGQFIESYSYYSSQDSKMPEIENAVMERLSERQAQLESKK